MILDVSKQWSLILTFASLWLSRFFEPAILNLLGFAGIITVGILHGSNDLYLLKLLSPGKESLKTRVLRHAVYVSSAVAILLIFIWIPSWVLYFFIGISAFHFGEQHFENIEGRRSWRVLLQLSYGLLLFSLLFYARYEEVIPVITEVTGHTFVQMDFGLAALLSAALFLLSWIVYSAGLVNRWLRILLDLLVFGVLYLLFLQSSVIWGFSVYFVLWHSLPSLRQQMQWLTGSGGWKGLRIYFSTAWPYWILALGGLLAMAIWGSRFAEHFLTILVYFLACITFPHVLVMTTMHRKLELLSSQGENRGDVQN